MKNWRKTNYKSDKDTVNPVWDNLSVKFHYNFIENSIIRYVDNADVVLDVGSGFGHWIKFYQEVYNSNNIESVEPGKNEFPCFKYNCYIQDFSSLTKYNVINAIGVLHHIMSDRKLKKALKVCYEHLQIGGYLIIGTRFDYHESPIEKMRKFRPLTQWKELLSDFNIIGIERSNPPYHCMKHLDIIICKKEK